MPELPEVQSTVNYLRERILGERISDIALHWERTLARGRLSDVKKSLLQTEISDVHRRGKFIVISLTSHKVESSFILFHLRMSGSLEVINRKEALQPHDRVRITFQSGKELRFNDIRKFGRMYVVKDHHEVTKKLGIEPLERSFNHEYLEKLFTIRKGAIKPLLLRQDLISGIGNIYADEALWYAKIHPLTRGNSIKLEKIKVLVKGIKAILEEAISLAGTDYGDGVVEGGLYQPRVYGREGEACSRCKGAIKRIVVGQRGTHFCPRCQRR